MGRKDLNFNQINVSVIRILFFKTNASVAHAKENRPNLWEGVVRSTELVKCTRGWCKGDTHKWLEYWIACQLQSGKDDSFR